MVLPPTNQGDEMNAGLTILIERMKTNPEEFRHGGKWTDIIERYKQYFSDEEKRQIKEAKRQMFMDEFAGVVMAELAGSPIKEEETLAYQESEKFIREIAEAEYRAKIQQEIMDKQRMMMNAARISNAYNNPALGQIASGSITTSPYSDQAEKSMLAKIRDRMKGQ